MRAQGMLFSALSIGLLGVMAQAQTADERVPTQAPGQVTRPKSFCKASDLIKYDVENDKGEDLGDVKDLLFDPVNERVAVIVVSYGGILGMGDKLYAVPWGAMSMPQNSKKIILKIAKDQIKQAPPIDGDHWPQTLDSKFATDLSTFYSVSPYWKDAEGASKTDAPAAGDTKQTTYLRRVSALLDAKVENEGGEKLGEVEDLAVATEEGRILYGVLSFGGILGMGEKYFAIPIACFDFKANDPKKLVLNIDKEKLKKAPGFDKGAWPNMADDRWVTEIHSYYDQKPYWERTKPRSQ